MAKYKRGDTVFFIENAERIRCGQIISGGTVYKVRYETEPGEYGGTGLRESRLYRTYEAAEAELKIKNTV